MTTTPTTYATRALSYLLGAGSLPPNRAKLVVWRFANMDDIAGQASLTKRYPVQTDLNAASAGVAGTPITSNVELTFGTAATGTAVEGALVAATVGSDAVEIKYPGMSAEALLVSGTVEQQLAVLQEESSRLAGMCFERFEADHIAAFANFATSVSTAASGTVRLSAGDLLTALYTYDIAENVTEERVFTLTPNQVDEVTRDLLITGGGLGGSLWTNIADATMVARGPLPEDGFRGGFLGVPVYQYSHSLRLLSDAAASVNGALMAVGRGDPITGQLGALGSVVRTGPSGLVRIVPQYENRERGVVIVASMHYAVVELRDSHGVRIRSRAP